MPTAAGLRADLTAARDRGELPADRHPLFARLDAAVTGLAVLTADLNAKGWSLGLARPDNIYLPPGGPPVLADLGFRWQGAFGPPPWDGSPGRPDWLADDGSFRFLWDFAPGPPAVRRPE